MAAPVLTALEQKKALSGKNKKKKTVKNILALPTNFQIESHTIKENEAEKLCKILSRLLPSAKIPSQPGGRFKSTEDKNTTPENSIQKETAKVKRKLLSLGVNEANKNLKKDLLCAVLLANDIQPKFFVHHLNLLCSHKNIPYLHVPGLRDVTQSSLGFPCIALGFKKNHNDFQEAIDKIKSISDSHNFKMNEIEGKKEESDSSELSDDSNDSLPKSNDTPFTYLYRTSTKERIFIPEREEKNEEEPKKEDFLPISKDDDDDDDEDVKVESEVMGISQNLIKKHKKGKMLNVEDIISSGSDEEEDLEVPKKKIKKDWVIDTVGEKFRPVNIMRFHSNPNRIKKKNKL